MADKGAHLDKLVNRVHKSRCLKFLKRLPDCSIDFCMTSPPYWKLRDYGIPGQMGQEKTPEEYIEKLVVIFRELKRVLKDNGSFYLNMGDTYIGTDNCRAKSWKRPKQLALIPSRVAIALQVDGWILRNDICWYKPNGLPSSVKDRLSCRWEHVFHFVKQRKYYYILDAIREPLKDSTVKRIRNRVKLHDRTGRPFTAKSKYFTADCSQFGSNGFLSGKSLGGFLNLKGGNPGDFWSISVKPLSMSHFAIYPEELCIRPIKSSCPPKGIVFDMFAGSGTTLVVAKKLGRRFIGCELNPIYVKLAKERIKSIAN
ncbi:MAG: site-specific DNA-methyltransferase [Candidatus Aminicenantes bacterium]|jgi:DNA modification methylase